MRFRSIDNIIRELKLIKKKYGVRGILFRDPMFSLDKKRTVKLAQEMIKNKINVKWGCETRLDFLDIKMLDIMYKSGLRSINVGIESVDEDVLKKSSRLPINIEHQEKVIRHCDKLGIHISAFYIFGFPDDNEQVIRKTVSYAKKLNTHIAQFTIATPLPGTGFFEEKKNDLLTNDYELFNSTKLVFKHKNLSPREIEKLREWAFVTYYFRPRYMLKYIKDLIRNKYEDMTS